MERLVVKRFNGDNHYLSVLSPQILYGNHETFNPSFMHKYQVMCVNSCGGLLCFDDFNGKIALCNLTTQELKHLPPSDVPRPPGITRTIFHGSGFGYDLKSNDYKVITYMLHYWEDEEGHYLDDMTKVELYSLGSNSWKEIQSPRSMNCPKSGSAFVDGSYYRMACLDTGVVVESFDFASETFSSFPLPPATEGSDSVFHLVKFDDSSVGAVGYERSGATKAFELWVWRGEKWGRVYGVANLSHVERPLGLRNGRLLFLERKMSDHLSHLVVYDWITKEMKKLEMYDYPGYMSISSYVESRFALPDSKPIN
ncbi:putative F-box protein [Salvia divinorum]|uniref:F-box protein n=1 Tax=Salvia divinorum TaxID=28513 RepID=A0ABD1GW05_SALDI